MTRRMTSLLLALGASAFAVCGLFLLALSWRQPALSPPAPPSAPHLTPFQVKVLAGARAQVGNTYDASYRVLSYPSGDPPKGQGACTDVVVRSLRAGGYDLQALVHEDMAAHWDQYPHKWGLPKPDPNIDHRRVPNLTPSRPAFHHLPLVALRPGCTNYFSGNAAHRSTWHTLCCRYL